MMSIDQFIEACREVGLNVTYQRIIIYKALLENNNHPSAEDIYHIVRREYPSISLATVYKTLETLAEHHLIAKVTELHDIARYDGDTSPHHHLICIKCKKIIDVYDEDLNKIKLPKDCSDGFCVFGYRIQFEGMCKECAEGMKQAAAAG